MSTTLHALGVTSVNVVGEMLEFLAAPPDAVTNQIPGHVPRTED